MTNAVSGVGTTISIGDGASPEVFTAIGEVTNLGGPEISAEEIETTSLDSVGGFKEFIGGLRDGGSVTLDMNYLGSNAQQNDMRDNIGGVTKNYQISWPYSPAVTCTFAAQVSNMTFNTEPNAAISASVSLKVSGEPTWSN